MVSTLLISDNLNGSSSRAMCRPRPAAYLPSSRTLRTPVCHCSAGRNHLSLPDVLAQHEQYIFGIVFVSQIQIPPAALDMEALHARVEVDESDGHARDADDRQASLFALAADEAALAGVEIERIGENVDGVEADFLGHADAEGGVAAGLRPGGVDESEFHGIHSGQWGDCGG